MMNIRAGRTLAIAVGLAVLGWMSTACGGEGYRSPFDVAYAPDGSRLAVSDRTKGVVYILDAASGAARSEVALSGKPMSLAWRDGRTVLVAEYDAGTVAEVDADAGSVVRRLKVGPKPLGVAVAGDTAVVTEHGLGQVYVIDLRSGAARHIATRGHPYFAAMDAAGALALVGHLIPDTASLDPSSAATVSVIDVKGGAVRAQIALPDGSSNVRGVAVSRDGRWGYVVHTRGRVTLPTTQLERGWVNTDALSIIDLPANRRLATVLLDYVHEGAADPWGLALSADGRTAWISLSGAQQVARVDLGGLHELMAGARKDLGSHDAYSGSAAETWAQIRDGKQTLDALSYHLSALYGMGLIRRTAFPANGPRGIAVSPRDGAVAVAAYFSGSLVRLDPASGSSIAVSALGDQPPADAAREGERIFHDATYCFQKWLSCATCHPAGGRADGLNWDLLNDGVGNAKNTKSLLWSDRTPPAMSTGVRPSMHAATAKGFQFIQFAVVSKADAANVDAYLASLDPEPSPYLVDGKLSEKARRGKTLFEDRTVGCAACHPAPLYTDLKTYDVGTQHERSGTNRFDNPTLVEMWRSGPFLHDGSAATMMDVLTTENKSDQHGKTSHLSREDLDALVEYLLSL